MSLQWTNKLFGVWPVLPLVDSSCKQTKKVQQVHYFFGVSLQRTKQIERTQNVKEKDTNRSQNDQRSWWHMTSSHTLGPEFDRPRWTETPVGNTSTQTWSAELLWTQLFGLLYRAKYNIGDLGLLSNRSHIFSKTQLHFHFQYINSWCPFFPNTYWVFWEEKATQCKHAPVLIFWKTQKNNKV